MWKETSDWVILLGSRRSESAMGPPALWDPPKAAAIWRLWFQWVSTRWAPERQKSSETRHHVPAVRWLVKKEASAVKLTFFPLNKHFYWPYDFIF